MARIVATVRVEIEQANGEFSSFERRTYVDCTDNPGYFSQYAEQAIKKSSNGALESIEGTHQPQVSVL